MKSRIKKNHSKKRNDTEQIIAIDIIFSNGKNSLIFSIFKIKEIVIKKIDQYLKFTDKLNKWSIIDVIQIINLYHHLSKNYNSNCSYE